jgi:hypothetical protein
MIKTTVNLSSELLADLDALAKKEGRSRAATIRAALDQYLADYQPLSPVVGIFDDHEVDSTNLNDWLRANSHSE